MKINNVTISGTEVQLSSLNIIVGSNGVGKTTLLNDLHEEFVNGVTNQRAKWTGLLREGSIDITLADCREWARELMPVSGETSSINGQSYKVFADPKSMGRQNKPMKLREDLVDRLEQDIKNNTLSSYSDGYFSIPLKDQRSIIMKVDDRFFLSNNNAGQYNDGAMNSTQPAPFLALNDDVLGSINKKLAKMFNKKLFSESRGQFRYTLYVGNKIKRPKRLPYAPKNVGKISQVFDDWISSNHVIEFSKEGHGIRAATQILYELETGSNKIVFIDEPELHMYPAAKYMMGRFIGDYAKKNKKQIILVTHDSDILHGLIDANAKTTIIRIGQDRLIRYIKGDDIRKTTPSETLQAAFLDAVILSEGTQDQFVYNNAFRLKKLLPNCSYQVLATNGKENISNDYYFFDSLGIKYATILDFDALYDNKNGISSVVRCLRAKNISSSVCKEINNKIIEVNKIMGGLDDRKRGLNCTSLKSDGKKLISELVDSLSAVGIFICPCGELEDWVGVSKGGDVTPELIYSKYKSRCNSKYTELTLFLEEIADYLENQ